MLYMLQPRQPYWPLNQCIEYSREEWLESYLKKYNKLIVIWVISYLICNTTRTTADRIRSPTQLTVVLCVGVLKGMTLAR